MNFQYNDKTIEIKARLGAFMDEDVYPNEELYHQQLSENRWDTPPIMATLKLLAKEQGLWNLYIPPSLSEFGGAGLSNVEYAPLAEVMGRVLWSPEVFNCNAPDTGNMEVFMKYATPAQQDKWLKPLLKGEIRSSYAMTEPQVASSDATNVECSIVRDGDEYVVMQLGLIRKPNFTTDDNLVGRGQA